MNQKTQAMRVLEGQGIHYTTYTYSQSERDAVAIASEIGVPAEEVFKTLVVVRKTGKPLLVLVPADKQLSLKKLAAQLGEKKVKMASQTDAERLTGLQVGGISPLVLLNRGFQIILDISAKTIDKIVLSGGQRGLQLQMEASDLIQVTKPKVVDLVD